MVDSVGTWGSPGQATLEHVGIVVLVALLMGGLGLWAVRDFRPPSSPPAIIERVSAPLLGGVQGAPVGVSGVARGVARQMERTGLPPSAASGAVRRAWEGLLWWGALNVDGQIEAGRGFLEQVGIRAEDLVKDPIKTVEGAVERLSKPPVSGTADRVARIAGTLATMGDRPFRESFLGISRNLGGIGADWLIAKYARAGGELLRGVLGT
jgi:hypothetical protein